MTLKPGNIGWAAEQLKKGNSVRRRGWNGKGMYIYVEQFTCQRGAVQYDPIVTMHTAQGTEQRGWLCSQADFFAEDWEHID